MKKIIVQVAVVAGVAFFALNNQAEAASVNIRLNLDHDKPCCVEPPHRHEVKKPKPQHHHKHDMKMDKHHRVVVVDRNRKECCHHGR